MFRGLIKLQTPPAAQARVVGIGAAYPIQGALETPPSPTLTASSVAASVCALYNERDVGNERSIGKWPVRIREACPRGLRNSLFPAILRRPELFACVQSVIRRMLETSPVTPPRRTSATVRLDRAPA